MTLPDTTQPSNDPARDAPFGLEDIVELYPRLFTEKRLDEWQALFDPRALTVRTESGGATTYLNIHDAMPEQWEYVAENAVMTEEWHNVQIHRYGNVAVIKADYVLTADAEVRRGVDVLTLVNNGDGWRIVNLAYEQTELTPR